MTREKQIIYQYLIDGIEEVYKNTSKSDKDFIDDNWKELCWELINEFKQKIKQYPSMKLITDDGTNAMVVTDKYNDGSGNKVKAILVYKNDTDDYK